MKKTYIVKRQHFGDRQYLAGEEREADPADVRHLVDDVLEEKATPKARNRVVRAVANKAG